MIKATVELTNADLKRNYPYIGKCEGKRDGDFCVLFYDKQIGAVIQVDSKAVYNIGHTEGYWCEDEFTPLPKGSKVILEQE